MGYVLWLIELTFTSLLVAKAKNLNLTCHGLIFRSVFNIYVFFNI